MGLLRHGGPLVLKLLTAHLLLVAWLLLKIRHTLNRWLLVRHSLYLLESATRNLKALKSALKRVLINRIIFLVIFLHSPLIQFVEINVDRISQLWFKVKLLHCLASFFFTTKNNMGHASGVLNAIYGLCF